MPLKFKSPGSRLNGRYIYYEPGVEYPFTSANQSLFITAIQEYRLANKKPRTTRNEIWEDAMDQMCQSQPTLCVDDDGGVTIGNMIKNAYNSITGWVGEGCPRVDDATWKKRVETCYKCPGGHWRGWQSMGIGQCKKCGCIAGSVSLKLYIPSEKCPKGYW